MLSPLNAAFGAVALAAAVIPLVHPAPKQPSDQERFAAAFERAQIDLRPVPGPPDVFVYEFSPADCGANGRLILAGYGSRALVRDVAGDAPSTVFFSGVRIDNLADRTLLREFITDQLASKAGFREEGSWSRRLVVVQAPEACPLTLKWDGVRDPTVVKG